MTALQSINICYEQKNIGGTYRLKVVERNKIAIPFFEIYQSKPNWLYGEICLLDEYAQVLKVEHQLSNNYTDRTLKVVFDTSMNVDDFRTWFNQNLFNRLVSLILIDENEQTELVHWMTASNFSKVSNSSRNTAKTIEINFVPNKIKPEYYQDNFEPVKELLYTDKVYPKQNGELQKRVNVEILLFDFVDKNFIDLRISTTNKILDSKPVLGNILNLLTGDYYLFAICKSVPTIYQIKEFSINTESQYSTITLQ